MLYIHWVVYIYTWESTVYRSYCCWAAVGAQRHPAATFFLHFSLSVFLTLNQGCCHLYVWFLSVNICVFICMSEYTSPNMNVLVSVSVFFTSLPRWLSNHPSLLHLLFSKDLDVISFHPKCQSWHSFQHYSEELSVPQTQRGTLIWKQLFILPFTFIQTYNTDNKIIHHTTLPTTTTIISTVAHIYISTAAVLLSQCTET